MQQNILKLQLKAPGPRHLVNYLRYKKYFRKTSLKQKGHGEFFLNEVLKKKPKTFLEIGVFHGVTAKNICELLSQIHKKEFKYIGLDLFEKNPLTWLDTMLNAVEHMSFFEGRATEYSKASTQGTWAEAFS